MTRRRMLLGIVLALAAAGFAWTLHLDSLEHANRIYREGEIEQARDLYLEQAATGAPEALYNAGTAELGLRPERARFLLEAAAAAGDSALLRDAAYNLGFFHLSQIRGGIRPDSAVVLAAAAIMENRQSLLMDPRFKPARHNLALAQEMFDSLSQQFRDSGREEESGDDDIRIDQDALARADGDSRSGVEPENPRPNDSQGNRYAATQGAREAFARQDPGPISEATARDLLRRVDHNPEKLIRGLIWANRPNVEWWNSEPYPGGNQ